MNRITGLLLVAPIALLSSGWDSGSGSAEPSIVSLRSLVDDFAHAIETNNLELALWYLHPDSPQRLEIDAKLRDQLASHLERARISNLDPLPGSDETTSLKVDQEIIRVAGLKLIRDTRRSIYHFRLFDGSWRIWGIDEVSAR